MDSLEEFATGDVDAFEVLFRQYQGEVYRWIVPIVRNPAVAEELTIDTFWRIYVHRQRFDAKRPFGPWARRIASRVAVDYLRSAARIPEQSEPMAHSVEADPLLQSELRNGIRLAFVSLPARLRLAATLALIEEVPYHEIAEALNISLSAVKMRVKRAMRLLRASLEKKGIRP